MTRKDEILILQHRLTEQTMLVKLSKYREGAHSIYRNFRLKGRGRFIAPPTITATQLKAERADEICNQQQHSGA